MFSRHFCGMSNGLIHFNVSKDEPMTFSSYQTSPFPSLHLFKVQEHLLIVQVINLSHYRTFWFFTTLIVIASFQMFLPLVYFLDRSRVSSPTANHLEWMTTISYLDRYISFLTNFPEFTFILFLTGSHFLAYTDLSRHIPPLSGSFHSCPSEIHFPCSTQKELADVSITSGRSLPSTCSL